MKLSWHPRISRLLALIVLLLAACSTPQTQTLSAPAPTQDMTVIAVAAEATLKVMRRSVTPLPTPTRAFTPTATITPSLTPTAPPTLTPALSSDYWIVYIFMHRLTALNQDASQITVLTNTHAIDRLPAWSRDGQTLAFLRFNAINLSEGILYTLPPGSNTPRRLDNDHLYSDFAWMPDSQWVLGASGTARALDIYLIQAVSGIPTLVARNVVNLPRISPDGARIAMLINTGVPCSAAGCQSPNDVFLFDLASKGIQRLTSDAQPKINLTWSPDSDQLAFAYAGGSSSQVDIVRANGSVIAAKQPLPWWAYPWALSPDGTQAAFIQNDAVSGSAEIQIMPLDGGESRRVARLEKDKDTPAFIDTLRWRPDGSGLIFNAWQKIFTIQVDGSDLQELAPQVDHGMFDVRPIAVAWTPPPEPTMPAAYPSCPDTLDTRLDIGRFAVVSTLQTLPNNVRATALTTGRLIGQIQPGEKMEILSGPICSEKLLWWEVQAVNTKLRGFTAEADQTEYWLVPSPP